MKWVDEIFVKVIVIFFEGSLRFGGLKNELGKNNINSLFF